MNIGERIKLMVTITKRGNGNKMVDFYKKNNLHYDFIILGTGTANSEILDYLGLETNEKDVVLTMIPTAKIPDVIKSAATDFKLESPGHGLVFTIGLTSVSARMHKVLCKDMNLNKETVKPMEQEKKFELILAISNHGYVDEIMKAAKSAGARGGTILHARRVGFEDVQNFAGFTIQPEKDVIAILADSTVRREISEKIATSAGVDTDARTMILSLPVDEIYGI